MCRRARRVCVWRGGARACAFGSPHAALAARSRPVCRGLLARPQTHARLAPSLMAGAASHAAPIPFPPSVPRAERGLRVQLVSELGRDKGAGTIQAVHADVATVLWDSGELEEGVPVGRAEQYYLRPVANVGDAYRLPARSQSPVPATRGSDASSQRQYVDRNSVDGLALRPAQTNSLQSPRQLPVRTVVSPRVMVTRPAGEDRGGNSRRDDGDGRGVDPSREGARAPSPPLPARLRSVGRPDLSMGLWDQLIPVGIPRHSSAQFGAGQRSSSPAPRQALVSKGGSTIGLSVYGTQIDYLVPGGPAHLCQKLGKDDEILSVDGTDVDFGNVVGCLQGTDAVGSNVWLRVRKQHTGEIVDVQLTRVPKASMENLVRIFQTLTQLKQNGHNNEGYERSSYPPEQDLTMQLVDKLVALISAVQIEKHNAEVTLKQQFSQIYDDLRAHLQQAYQEIDVLRAQEHANSEYKERCERMAEELEEVKMQTQVKQTARAQRSAPPPPPAAEDIDTRQELETKKSELARELENGMQKEFEIRRLNAQSELLLKELETAKRTMLAKDRELQQRSLEDKELERKIQALQEVLESTSGEAARYKEECEKLRLQLEDVTVNQIEKMQMEVGHLETQLTSRIKLLEEQLLQEKQVSVVSLGKSDKRIEALQKMLDDRDSKLSETTNLAVSLEALVKELQAKLAAVPDHSYRSGDICEAAIISAHNLPGPAELETTVMLALDHRHQVQQTRRVVGAQPIFEEEFIARLAADTKVLTCTIYRSNPEEPGELVGNCSIPIGDIPVAPGTEMEVPVMTDDDPSVPLVVDGKQAMIKVFLARSNPRRSGRKPDEGPPIDPAHVRRLEDDIASARLLQEKLEADFKAEKVKSKALEGVEKQLMQTQVKLTDSEKAHENLTRKLRETREQVTREMQDSVQQKQLEIQQRDSKLMLLQDNNNSLNAELDKLRNSLQVKERVLTDVQGELSVTKSALESLKRDGNNTSQLAELASKLEQVMTQLGRVEEERKAAVADAERELAKSQALQEHISTLERENQTLKAELKRLMDDLEKLTRDMASERDELSALRGRINSGDHDKLKSENVELSSVNSRLRQEVELARAAIEEARRVDAESSRLRRELEEGRTKVTELEAEVARLREQQQPDDDIPVIAKKERRAVQRSGLPALDPSSIHSALQTRACDAHTCRLTQTIFLAPSQRPRHPPLQPVPHHPRQGRVLQASTHQYHSGGSA